MAASSNNNTISKKSLTAWSRLEPRARQEDFSRNLKAEIRDPLWMLCRQWQWGEFKGEDTGSAIYSKINFKNTRITKFQKGGVEIDEINSSTGKSTFDNSGSGIPMEARVEQRPIPMDFQMGLKLGLRFKKMLINNALYESIRILLPFDDISTNLVEAEQFKTNRKLYQTYESSKNRVLDGRKIYNGIVENGDISSIPALSSLSLDPSINTIGENFVKWFDGLYLNGNSNQEAWHPKHLEYQFSCKIPVANTGGSVSDMDLLTAKEYYQGKLDWYSFDFDKTDGNSTPTEPNELSNTDIVTIINTTTMPTGIEFPGIPKQRWWEFEDGYVNLGNIDAHTTDTAKLLFAEFGLVYGNDWNIVPYEIPIGSLSEIKSIVVTDNFGIKTIVNEAGAGVDNNWQEWSMFNLNVEDEDPYVSHPRDNRLFIPPVVQHVQESKPIESVNFIKDEVGNMVWAVESIIPNELGGGMNGYEAARQLVDVLSEDDTILNNTDKVDGTFAKYILSNTVPENWIPFVPINTGANAREIQFQRGVMPRVISGKNSNSFTTGDKLVKPRSILLNELQDPAIPTKTEYYVYEEEVPRAGTIVKRTFQRVRWFDGSTHVWVGMRKTVGKGEGSSGLKFDKLES